jgi:prepilin-type N-terminal cleavage/methylation domain-containing protein
LPAANLQPDRRPRRAGFTLVEALIVVVIVGVFAAIAAPRFADASHRYRARLSAQVLAREIERVAALARASRTEHRVTFDTANDTCKVIRISDGRTLSVLALGQEQDATIHSVHFNGSAKLTLDGYGQPSSGGTVVTQAGGWYAALSVEAETGQVLVAEKVTLQP